MQFFYKLYVELCSKLCFEPPIIFHWAFYVTCTCCTFNFCTYNAVCCWWSYCYFKI